LAPTERNDAHELRDRQQTVLAEQRNHLIGCREERDEIHEREAALEMKREYQ
jgi:hypothetical protein